MLIPVIRGEFLLQIARFCGIVRPATLTQLEEFLPRGGTPPLVPMWPGVRVIEQNPFPFFPFNPRWRTWFTPPEFDTFCALLRLAWISPRPCFLPPETHSLARLLEQHSRGPLTEQVLAQFEAHEHTGLLYFPPQLRSLERLVRGEDLYALLWDENL